MSTKTGANKATLLVSSESGLTQEIETHDIRHVFAMTGAVPSTAWLDGCLALDAKGFIRTGAARMKGNDHA